MNDILHMATAPFADTKGIEAELSFNETAYASCSREWWATKLECDPYVMHDPRIPTADEAKSIVNGPYLKVPSGANPSMESNDTTDTPTDASSTRPATAQAGSLPDKECSSNPSKKSDGAMDVDEETTPVKKAPLKKPSALKKPKYGLSAANITSRKISQAAGVDDDESEDSDDEFNQAFDESDNDGDDSSTDSNKPVWASLGIFNNPETHPQQRLIDALNDFYAILLRGDPTAIILPLPTAKGDIEPITKLDELPTDGIDAQNI